MPSTPTNRPPGTARARRRAASTDAIPTRGLEALRQGIQEYKRIYELRRRGVAEATLQGLIERGLNARSVSKIDELRGEMDDMLGG